MMLNNKVTDREGYKRMKRARKKDSRIKLPFIGDNGIFTALINQTMFSKTCEYAIRAVIFIASESYKDKRVGLKAIAEKISSPEAFTAKILQTLVKHNIIKSTKGPTGGFDVPKASMRSIYLSQIVSAIDGDSVFNRCALGLEECSEVQPCPLHSKFKPIRADLEVMLCGTNLEELALGLKSGNTFLKI